MSNPTLDILFGELHTLIESKLQAARRAFSHPTAKGDASESAWLDLLGTYLPARYSVAKAFAVDHKGTFSQQLDVVIYDRQYSPFIFTHEGQNIIPAESIYAVFEAKQDISAQLVKYAHEKIASVRALERTSLPIPTANGEAQARPPKPILGGFLSLESTWSPPLGDALVTNLGGTDYAGGRLDLGCIASHGIFVRDGDGHVIRPKGKPATAFLLELVAQLQTLATVPMIDIRSYAKWLEDPKTDAPG